MDREDYGAYYRKFTLYAKFLKSITHLSERDERLQFVDGLPESLREKVLRRLELTHPAVAVSAGYPVADSHEAALRVFSDSDYTAVVVPIVNFSLINSTPGCFI